MKRIVLSSVLIAWAAVQAATTTLSNCYKIDGRYDQPYYLDGEIAVVTNVTEAGAVAEPLFWGGTFAYNSYSNRTVAAEGRVLREWVLADMEAVTRLPARADLAGFASYTNDPVRVASNDPTTGWSFNMMIVPCFETIRYALAYHSNDGRGNAIREKQQAHAYDEPVVLETNRWTRLGYDFTGWATATNGLARLADGATVTGADFGLTEHGVVDLYAAWRKRDMVIALDPMAGEVATTSIVARIGETYALPTPTREHYVFSGWHTAANGGQLISDGDEVKLDSITALYAHWDVERIALTIGSAEPHNGTVSPAGVRMIDYNETLTLSANPERGCAFVAWNDGSTEPRRVIRAQTNAVYWARFAETPPAVDRGKAPPPPAPQAQTVYFLANGGSGVMEPQVLSPGQRATLRPNTFTRAYRVITGSTTNAVDGTFLGWADSPTATTNEIVYADAAIVTDPAPAGYRALYAVWAEPDVAPQPDPPPSGPTALTLTPTDAAFSGWTFDGTNTWSSASGNHYISVPRDEDLPNLELVGTVTGSGVLTFDFSGRNGNCDFGTNGNFYVKLSATDWTMQTVSIETASPAEETRLAWRRYNANPTAIRNVIWTPDTNAVARTASAGGARGVTPVVEPIAVPQTAWHHVVPGLVFDGSEKTGVVAVDGCSVADATGTSATNAQATVTLTDGWKWPDGGTDRTRLVDWTIAKGDYDMSGVSFSGARVFADGTPKSLAIDGTLPTGVTVAYEGNGETKPGTYTVKAVFTGDAENDQPIPSLSATLTIVDPLGPGLNLEPVFDALPVGAVSAFDTVVTYDGAPHTIDAEALTAAYAPYVQDGLAVTYRAADGKDWVSAPPTQTAVGTLTITYRVPVAERENLIHDVRLTVEPCDLSAATLAPIPDGVWTGSALEPAVAVTIDGRTLSADDYTVAYTNNVAVGTASVTVTGRGNYTGCANGSFRITPKPDPRPKPPPRAETLHPEADVAPCDAGYAATFSGWLADADGRLAGLMSITTSPAQNGMFRSTITVTWRETGRRETVRTTVDPTDREGYPTDEYGLVYTDRAVMGTFRDLIVETSEDLLRSRRADEKALIAQMPRGVLNLVFETEAGYVMLAASVSSGGRTRVTVLHPDGTRTALTTLGVLGEKGIFAVPVLSLKAACPFGLVIWSRADGSVDVSSVPDGWRLVACGSPASTMSGSYALIGTPVSRTDRDYVTTASVTVAGEALSVDLLDLAFTASPEALSVPKANGVPHLTTDGDVVLRVDPRRPLANPASLRLRLAARTGQVKGSYSLVFIDDVGRLRKDAVVVTGVVIGDRLYATGTIRKVGSFPLTSEARDHD